MQRSAGAALWLPCGCWQSAVPAPAVVKAEPVYIDPTRPSAYVGAWKGQVGAKTFTVKGGHITTRADSDGNKSNGIWEIVDGIFRCNREDHGTFSGKLSEDGQTMSALGGTNAIRVFQKP